MVVDSEEVVRRNASRSCAPEGFLLGSRCYRNRTKQPLCEDKFCGRVIPDTEHSEALRPMSSATYSEHDMRSA